MGRDEVADESEDLHDRVLGHADAVAPGDLGDCDPSCDSRVEIDVVRSDSRGDGEFEIRCFRDALLGQVGRPEGLRDDDVGVDEFLLERRVRALLVGCHYQGVAGSRQVLTKS